MPPHLEAESVACERIRHRMAELGYTHYMDVFPRCASSLLSVSIVIYEPDLALLGRTFLALGRAAARLGEQRCSLIMVDNSTPPLARESRRSLERLLPAGRFELRWRAGHGNVGYGQGHNLALETVDSRWHLVLNPDVEMADDALENALGFMEKHPDCVLLSPVASWADGRVQHLCKRFPSLGVLLLRGFASERLKRRFDAVLARYEYREAAQDETLWDPLLVSGCFMFFQTKVLRRLGGFDESYFLYFEDFDLSLRAARFGRLARAAQVRVVHHGGNAARKGRRHLLLFLASAWRFYRGHGLAGRRGVG